MAKVLRLTDRVKITVKDVSFVIAPLDNGQKLEIGRAMRKNAGEDEINLVDSQHLYIKYGLKELHGVEDFHGNKYELRFEGDHLTDDCVSEICSMEQKTELMTECWKMMGGLDDETIKNLGKKIKGVRLDILPMDGGSS